MLGWLWKWLGHEEEKVVVADLAPEADVVTKVDPAVVKKPRKVTVKKVKVIKKAKK